MKRLLFLLIASFVMIGSGAVAANESPPSLNPESDNSTKPAPPTTISFGNFAFDPLVQTQSASETTLNAAGEGLYLMQLHDTLSDADEAILSEDVTLLQYIPHNTYLVWATPEGVNSAGGRSNLVRWTGAYTQEMRLDPQLGEHSAENLVALLLDDGSLAQFEAHIVANDGYISGADPIHLMGEKMQMFLYRLTIPATTFDYLSTLPNLIHLNMHQEVQPLDESAAMVIANQLDGTNGPDPNIDYARWLAGIGYYGSGVTVAVTDTGVDWDNPDLMNSMVSGTDYGGVLEPGEPGSDPPSATHGTRVAGIIAGDGTTNIYDPEGFEFGLGVAPGSGLHANNFLSFQAGVTRANVWADVYNNADLHNASWGGGTNGDYAVTSMDIDDLTHDALSTNAVQNPHLTIFGAGNSGPNATTISVNAAAKNIIAVGALNSDRTNQSGGTGANIDTIWSGSSRGPAADGRIKPDIVAAGLNIISTSNTDCSPACGGIQDPPGASTTHGWFGATSSAAPQVAGVAALFTEFWRDYTGDPDRNPDPALVKAALIATTETQAGVPNGAVGWGRVNAGRLLEPSVPILYFENPQIFTSGDDAWSINVVAADPNEPLRITLVWSDAPGAANANPALVNDIDLIVFPPDGSPEYWGNNFGSNGWSVPGSFDAINNVENVWIENPQTGAYTIEVDAWALNGDGYYYNGDSTDQHFSLVCYNCIEKLYVDDSVEDGLVGYWKFDKGSGFNYFDFSGKGNHAQDETGSNDWHTDTPTGHFYNPHSLHVDGSTEYAFVPDNDSLDVGDNLTVAGWIKTDSSGTQKIVVKATLAPVKGYIFGIRDGQLDAEVWSTNGVQHRVFAGSIPIDVWTHVAMSYSRGGYLIGYVNGVEVGRVNASNFGVGTNSGDLRIAAPSWNASLEEFDGHLDEIRVYDRALNATEIGRLADGFDCETDGTAWHSAHAHLQCALTVANEYPTISEIYVAEGVYQPGTDRSAAFHGRDDLTVRGGFAGTMDNDHSWTLFPTVLNGDLDDNDGDGAPTGDNSYNLVINEANNFTLEGFTIENGLANGASADLGGGILNSAWGTYRHLIVRNNVAVAGGGIFAHSEAINISQSLFVGNHATNDGGAIYTLHTPPTIVGSIFSGNTAEDTGGAIFMAGSGGSPNPHYILNSTFHHNYATNFPISGAIWSQDTNLQIWDSILWGNNPSGSQQLNHVGTGTPQLNYNIIEGGWSGAGGNNLDSDPLFIDPDGVDDVYGTADDNLRIPYNSPATDSGDSVCTTTKYVRSADIDGDNDGVAECDRGAYEYGTLLLVDDAQLTPEIGQKPYRHALENLDYAYEVWDTNGSIDELPANYLDAFSSAVWFSGEIAYVNGPTLTEENALGSWLDGAGNCLLISSQEYLFDSGLTQFMESHLGVAAGFHDVEQTSITGSGLVYGGIGTHDLTFPSDFTNWSDNITPHGGAQVAFTGSTGNAGINYVTQAYRTTFLGFPLEILPDSEIEAVLGAFLGTCTAQTAPTAVGMGSVSAETTPSLPLLTIIIFLTALTLLRLRGTSRIEVR